MNAEILLQIIIAAIAGTTVMTLFSYTVSASAKELYKEPILLAYILDKLHIEVATSTKIILGWILHYSIGFCFVLVYHILWFYDIIAMSWFNAFLLGIVSGLIGIASWIVLFKITPQKPNIDFKGYYTHLFLAHILFALVAFWVYQFF